MKAYIMINVRTGSIPEVVENIKKVNGIKEANMTFGTFDVIALIQADDVHQIGRKIAHQIQPIPGIIDTLTCLVLDF